jgi:hypothetical protein
MDVDAQRLEEYKALRGTIDQHVNSNLKIFVFAVTATGALIGYALTSTKPLVFLTPLIILIPSVYIILGQLYHLFRIAAYIRVVLETQLGGIKWETNWAKVRSSTRSQGRDPLWKLNEMVFILIVLHALGGICVVMSFLYGLAEQLRPFPIRDLIITALLLHGCLSWYHCRTATDAESHARFWKEGLELDSREADT